MNSAIKKSIVYILFFVMIGVMLFLFKMSNDKSSEIAKLKKENRVLIEENVKLLKEQKMVLPEYKKVLEENNRMLRKELVKKYMEYIIDLTNKVAAEKVVPEEDKKLFSDRSAFVIENMGLLEMTDEEAKTYIKFLLKMKDNIAPEKEAKDGKK